MVVGGGSDYSRIQLGVEVGVRGSMFHSLYSTRCAKISDPAAWRICA